VCDGTGDDETCDKICNSGSAGSAGATGSGTCEYPECSCDNCVDTCLCQGIDDGTCTSLCGKADGPGPTANETSSSDTSAQQGSCAASVVGSRASMTREGSALACLLALGFVRVVRRRRR
jgi:hypothetical protein